MVQCTYIQKHLRLFGCTYKKTSEPALEIFYSSRNFMEEKLLIIIVLEQAYSNTFWKDRQTSGHIVFFIKRVSLKVIQNENRELE